VQQLKATDKGKLCGICSEYLEKVDNNDSIASKLIFSDDTTFYPLKRVNRHNLRICVIENPRDSFEHEWDMPKLNNFVAGLELKVRGRFYFLYSI
jgi:hypothetical protein